MGVGTAIGVGSFVTAGYLTGTAAAVLGGAIIGAAIGGLTTAVMGGNIGKGVLFGAIGGAVMGGISGTLNTAATSTTTSAATGAGAGTTVNTAQAVSGASQAVYGIGGQAGSVTIGQGATTLATETTKAGLLENAGSYLTVNALTEGVKGYLANEAADKEAEALSEQSELQRQHEKDMLQMKLDAEAAGSGASGGDELAYKARMSELEQRRKEFERTMGLQEDQWGETKKATAARKALFEGVGRDRGATVESDNTVAEVGIFDKLEEKPVSALKTEKVLAP